MKKLLLLVILGIGLGGGVWLAENPGGSLADLKTQSISTSQRLAAELQSLIPSLPDRASRASLEDRLALLEQKVNADSDVNRLSDIESLIEDKIAGDGNTLTSLQESLNDRVAPLEDITTGVAQLNSALQDTRARTDADNVRIDTIERRLELLVRRLDEQSSDTDSEAVQQSLDAVQAQLETLQQQILDSQVQFVDKLSDMTEQNGRLGLRLDTLAAGGAADQTSDAADGNETADSSALRALSSSVDTRLLEIEQRLSTVNADSRNLQQLAQQLNDATARFTELERRDAQTIQSLEELKDAVEALATAGETLSIESIQAQVRDQLALAQAQFDSSAQGTNSNQLQALLDNTRNRIQALEQRVQNLPLASSEASDALEIQSALQAQISDLEQRLSRLTESDSLQAGGVNNARQQVETLSEQGFVMPDDVNADQPAESIEYKIYFDRNNAEISPDAARVLDSFIAQEKNRTTGVSIFGFTDRSGSSAYNQQLALQRATNVRTYLIQNGLDFTKVKALSGLSEDAAAAVLPENADAAQQRVVLLYAAQP